MIVRLCLLCFTLDSIETVPVELTEAQRISALVLLVQNWRPMIQ